MLALSWLPAGIAAILSPADRVYGNKQTQTRVVSQSQLEG